MIDTNTHTMPDLASESTTTTINADSCVDTNHNEHLSIAMFKMDLFRVLIASLGCLLVWKYGLPLSVPYLLVILVIVILSGFPIFIEALENVQSKHMTMELSMTIAIIAALYIEEVFTALIIIAFVLVAEMLEELTVERGRRAVADILQYLPQTITIMVNNEDKVIPIQELQIHDIILLKPGIRIPVDGTVLTGRSFVDQSVITGESLPVEKLPGAKVFAGSINQLGTLQIQTERIGANTVFGSIIEEVEKANKSQAPIQKIADRLAGYLVYVALSASLLTYVFTSNIRSAISVIIVAGACGIAAGTPLAILGALGQATMLGTIIKGGVYLEKLAEVDTVILDKTGTLTLGRPEVTAMHCQPGITDQELLFTAACVERLSEHPIAQAILQKAKDMNISLQPVDEFHNQPGKGIRGMMNKKTLVVGTKEWLIESGIPVNPNLTTHNSEIYIGSEGVFLGSIEIADKLREEAYDVIQDLHSMNISTILLSGDDPVIANKIGTALGVDEIQSGLLPAEKASWIEKYTLSGRHIAMVGDGVNDALALKTAHVGIAMGSGTDITKETADVILIGNDLRKMVAILRLSHRTKHTIMENFYGTLLVDGIGMIMAGLGLLIPIFAAFVHVTSELIFIFNSARLIPIRRMKEKNEPTLASTNQKLPILVPKSIQDLSSS